RIRLGDLLSEPLLERLTFALLLGGGAEALTGGPLLGGDEALVERVVETAVDQRLVRFLTRVLRIGWDVVASGGHVFTLPRSAAFSTRAGAAADRPRGHGDEGHNEQRRNQ